jgi:hypothetical protein
VEARNPGFGPTPSYLLSVGAKFSRCMRDDEEYIKEASRQRVEECGPDRNNPCESGDPTDGHGIAQKCPAPQRGGEAALPFFLSLWERRASDRMGAPRFFDVPLGPTQVAAPFPTVALA